VLILGKLWSVVFVIWPWNDIFVSSISIPEPSEALDSYLYQNVMCDVHWLHIGRQSFTWNMWEGLYTTVIWSKQQEKTRSTNLHTFCECRGMFPRGRSSRTSPWSGRRNIKSDTWLTFHITNISNSYYKSF